VLVRFVWEAMARVWRDVEIFVRRRAVSGFGGRGGGAVVEFRGGGEEGGSDIMSIGSGRFTMGRS